jgi:hypothetical protein
MSENTKKAKKESVFNESIINQITVLRTLSKSTGQAKNQRKTLAIQEIAEMSGVTDEREIQRYLFILEGQKLVSPLPEGDFTSRNWSITKNGIEAIRKIDKVHVN